MFNTQLFFILILTTFSYSPFPTVAESIQKELDDYRSSEDEVKKLKNVMVRLTLVRFLTEFIIYLQSCTNFAEKLVPSLP